MTGTFASFNTGLSALRYQQLVIDAASNNVANATTSGYTRQRVESGAASGIATSALWSTSTVGINGGVNATGITRVGEDFLAARSRSEHGTLSYLQTQASALGQIESGIDEPSDTGLSAALSALRSSWSDLSNNPADTSLQGVVLSSAQLVVQQISQQSTNLQETADSTVSAMSADITSVNQVASSLAEINKAISAAGNSRLDMGGLLDQRDRLAMQLSELTGARTTIAEDSTATVTLDGHTLVAGRTAGTLSVASGVDTNGAADGNTVTFSLTDTAGQASIVSVSVGSVGADAEVLNSTISTYRSSLNELAANLADSINSALTGGYDASGNPGTALFTYTAGGAARSLSVSLTDGSQLGTSSAAGSIDGQVARTLAGDSTVEDDYSTLVSQFASHVQSVETLEAGQSSLTTQVDASVDSLAGVNIDEEMVTMMQAQRGYQAASRVISTVDAMLDTLINRMGA